MKSGDKVLARIRRKVRIRKKLSGTSERPRLVVFKSSKHIYAQIIDDTKHMTLLSASSLSKELQEQLKNVEGKIAVAQLVGKFVAQKAKANGITRIAFDRGGYIYHGRVKALADSAREAGLEF
ncbi:MAG: 50S ribosomal protein L18 [Deltaproteobacteria bacterium]|jgi:large subunit ribosomal protein L18|nr:50S ribosomal protein L18 [Deltaproteobacteria bacterium]